MDLLKRHNAMCIKNYVSHQHAMFRENILLAENLISMLGESTIKIGRSATEIRGNRRYCLQLTIVVAKQEVLYDLNTFMMHCRRRR